MKPALFTPCGSIATHKFCAQCGSKFTKSDLRSPGNFPRQRYCGAACAFKARKFTPDQIEATFWTRVNKSEGCWLWTGALQRDGYAHFGMNGKTVSAHRYAYEVIVGPIPEGMDLLHSCDVRHCVNPGHLRPGTHTENMIEMRVKERNSRGLPHEKVREVRRLLLTMPQPEVSRATGVPYQTVNKIARNISYRWVQ